MKGKTERAIELKGVGERSRRELGWHSTVAERGKVGTEDDDSLGRNVTKSKQASIQMTFNNAKTLLNFHGYLF